MYALGEVRCAVPLLRGRGISVLTVNAAAAIAAGLFIRSPFVTCPFVKVPEFCCRGEEAANDGE
jgi:hypothetical protein